MPFKHSSSFLISILVWIAVCALIITGCSSEKDDAPLPTRIPPIDLGSNLTYRRCAGCAAHGPAPTWTPKPTLTPVPLGAPLSAPRALPKRPILFRRAPARRRSKHRSGSFLICR